MTNLSIGDDVKEKDSAVIARRSIAAWTKGLLAICLTVLFAPMVVAQSNITSLNFELVGSGLSRPVFATSAPGDSSSLFVLEQHAGRIQRIDLSTGTRSTFATLPNGTVSTRNEQGLLGLAFHPDYQTNGRYYLNILSVEQPFTNHNAGWMGFGPDGNLYIATGDGGSGNDPFNNSQTITNNLLGKILRVNVDGDDFANDNSRNYSIPNSNPFVGQTGDDEIFAYGLRNPYRSSFDSATGDLWIGDVGQGLREEIDIILAGTSGQNFGWRTREGTLGPAVSGAIDPVYQYSHGGGDNQGFSVTGGYVYRGSIPALDGHYFFSDFVTDRLWSFKFNGDGQANFDATNFTDFTDWSEQVEIDQGSGTIRNVSSFGEDPAGNLIVVSLDGNVFRLSSITLLGDVNLDGVVDFSDIPAFIAILTAGGFQTEADTNRDGDIDFADIPPFIDILISQ